MGSAKPAFLYVIGSAEPGPHKVGISTLPQKRLRSMQTGNHRRLLLKRATPSAVENAAAVEAYVHWLLRESQVLGEWFDVSEDAAWVALVAAEKAVANGLRAPRSIAGTGRPVLSARSSTAKTMIRLPLSTRERIKAVAGPQGMADFIRSAIDAELKRRERTRPSKTS